MKLHGLARASLALAIAACSPGRDAAVAVAESPEIGVCGANADPVTGVICKGYFSASNNGWLTFGSSEAFEQDGFDYVRCTWNTNCARTYYPISPDGVGCNSVIGTGCPEFATVSGTLVYSYKLPVGTMANQLDAYCQKPGHEPSYSAVDDECRKMTSTIEQYEDQCCVPRQPKPDGGVSYDAGMDANADAAVDAAIDAGGGSADAGYDAEP